jgi:hypothetical protein
MGFGVGDLGLGEVRFEKGEGRWGDGEKGRKARGTVFTSYV